VAVLAAAARLLDELALLLDRLLEGLAVGDLRLAHRSLHAELALHTVDDDLEVQLAHAGDDGLARLLVGAHAERRILLREAPERHAHPLLVGLGLGLHGLRDHRLREHHALKRDRLLHVADGLACDDLLEAHHGRDVAGTHFLDFLALVGMHLEQATDALLLAAHRSEYRIAGSEHTRVKDSWPTNGSVMILNASAAKGSSSPGLRTSGSPFSFSPFTGGMSIGEGR